MASLDFDSLPDIKTDAQPKQELNFDALPDIDFDSLPDKPAEAIPTKPKKSEAFTPTGEPADPFADESRWSTAKRRAQQFTTAATDMVATVPEAAAINSRMLDVNKVQSGKAAQAAIPKEQAELEKIIADNEGKDDTASRAKVNAAKMRLEVLKGQARQADILTEDSEAAAAIPMKDTFGFKSAEAIRSGVESVVGKPDARDQSFGGKLASGAGSMAGFVIATMIGNAAAGPIGATAIGGTMGSMSTEAQMYKEAIAAGASEQEAMKAAKWGALIGSAEVVPVLTGLKYVPAPFKLKFGNIIAKKAMEIAESSGEEFAQEYLSQVAQNLAGYENKPWNDGALENGIIGAILGGGTGAVGAVTGGHEVETVPEKGATDEQKAALGADDKQTAPPPAAAPTESSTATATVTPTATEPNREPAEPTPAPTPEPPKTEAPKEQPKVNVGENSPDVTEAVTQASNNEKPTPPPAGSPEGSYKEFLKKLAEYKKQQAAQQAPPQPVTATPPVLPDTAPVAEGPQVGGAPAAPPNPAPLVDENGNRSALLEAQKMIADQGVQLTPESQQALADDYSKVDHNAPDFQEQMQALVDKYVSAGQSQQTDALPPAQEITPAQTTAPSDAGGSAPATPPATSEVTPPAEKPKERKYSNISKHNLLAAAGFTDEEIATMSKGTLALETSAIRSQVERDTGEQFEYLDPEERKQAIAAAWGKIKGIREKAAADAQAKKDAARAEAESAVSKLPPKAKKVVETSKAKEGAPEVRKPQLSEEEKARILAEDAAKRNAGKPVAPVKEQAQPVAQPVTQKVTETKPDPAAEREARIQAKIEEQRKRDAEEQAAAKAAGKRPVLRAVTDEAARKDAEAAIALEDQQRANDAKMNEPEAAAEEAPAEPVVNEKAAKKLGDEAVERRAHNNATASEITKEFAPSEEERNFDKGREGANARKLIIDRARNILNAAQQRMKHPRNGSGIPGSRRLGSMESLQPNNDLFTVMEARDLLKVWDNPSATYEKKQAALSRFMSNEFILRQGMRDDYLAGTRAEGASAKGSKGSGKVSGEEKDERGSIEKVADINGDEVTRAGENPDEPALIQSNMEEKILEQAAAKPAKEQDREASVTGKVTKDVDYSVGAKPEGTVTVETKKKRTLSGLAGKAKSAATNIKKGDALKELEADRRAETENVEALKRGERNTLNSDVADPIELDEGSGVEVPSDYKDKSFVAALRRMLKSFAEPGTNQRYLAGVAVDFGTFSEMAARLNADTYFDAVVNRRFVRTFGASFLRQENIQKLLFNRIGKVAGDTPVYIIPDRVMDRIKGKGKGTSAFYSPVEDHIVMRESSLRSPDAYIHDLMHEGAHAALWHAVRSSPENRRQLATILAEYRKQWIEYGNEPDRVRNAYAKYDEASARLEEMYQKMGTPEWTNEEHDAVENQKVEAFIELKDAINEAQQDKNTRANMDAYERPYVFYNIDEFLSELISNPDVMKDLSGFTVHPEAFEKVGVPAPKGKLGTVMEFIKSLVAKALELPSLFKGPNAYEQSLELVDKLLMRAQRDRREFYSRDENGKVDWLQERQDEYNDYASKNYAYHNDYTDRLRRKYEESTWFDAKSVDNRKSKTDKHVGEFIKRGIDPKSARKISKIVAEEFGDTKPSAEDYESMAQAFRNTEQKKEKAVWTQLTEGKVPYKIAMEINSYIKEELGKTIDPETVPFLVEEAIKAYGVNTSQGNEGYGSDGGAQPPYSEPPSPGMGPGKKPEPMKGWRPARQGSIPSALRRFALRTMTLDFMRQKYGDLMRTVDGKKPLDTLIKAEQKREGFADEFALPIEKAAAELEKLRNDHLDEYEELVDLAMEASRLNVKLGQGSMANSHLGTNSAKGLQGKKALPKLNERYDRLSPRAKEIYQNLTKAYREAHNANIKGQAYNVLREMQPRLSNSDLMRLLDRVTHGRLTEADAHIIGDKTLFNQLKRATELKLVEGDYFPMMRYGEHVVTTREKLENPGWTSVQMKVGKKAQAKSVPVHTEVDDNVVRVTVDPSVRGSRTAVKRKMQEWAAGHELTLQGISTKFRDKKTGKIVTKGEQLVDRDYDVVYEAEFQTEGAHFFESEKEAWDFVDAQPYDNQTSEPMKRRDYVDSSAITGSTLANIVNSIKAGSDIGDGKAANGQNDSLSAIQRQRMINLVQNAVIGQMSGNRAQKRYLQRRGVKGASKDLIRGAFTYARAGGNYYATLQIAPEIRDAMQELAQLERDLKYTARASEASQVMNELKLRIEGIDKPNKPWKLTRDIATLSYFDKLISPMFSYMNALQPLNTTWPMLAGRYGSHDAGEALANAYKIVGMRDTIGAGAMNTIRAARDITKTMVDSTDLVDRLRKNAGKRYEALIDELTSRGLLSMDTGLEIGSVIEEGRGAFGRGLHKVDRVARQLPNGVEVLNRAATAIAAYDLARKNGKSHQAAIDEAYNTVSNTQGDYRGSNSPRFMKAAGVGWAMQFQKYTQLHAQLFFDMLSRSLTSSSKAERIIARKQFMHYMAANAMLAGTFGLPGYPLVKAGFLLASMLTGGGGWDDEEDKLRKKIDAAAKAVAGENELGRRLAILFKDGAFSAVTDLDFGSRLGMSDMLIGRPPAQLDRDGIFTYAAQLIGGAPGATAVDWITGTTELLNANSTDATQKAVMKLIPMKMIADTVSAVRNYENGQVGVGGAIANAIGIRTVEQADKSRETGVRVREAERRKAKKIALSNDLRAALDRKDIPAQAKAISAIREYNTEQAKIDPAFKPLNPKTIAKYWAMDKLEAEGKLKRKTNAP